MSGLSPVFAWPRSQDIGAGIRAALGAFRPTQAFSMVANIFLTWWKMQPVISAAVFLKGLAGITRCLSKSVSWGQGVLLAVPPQANSPNVVIPWLSKAHLRDYRVYRKVILNFSELWSSVTSLLLSWGVAQAPLSQVASSAFPPSLAVNCCCLLRLIRLHFRFGVQQQGPYLSFLLFLSLDAEVEP